VSELTVCTIVSANYLAFARVLAASLAEYHPEARVVVLLVDRADGRFDPDQEPFELLQVEEMPTLPEPLPFLFKYTVLEANTAVKPYLLEHLLSQGAERVLYLDPDIQLFGRLQMVEEALDSANIVLTPHLTAPIDDGRMPDELAIMRSGTYNLGFLALARSDTTDAFLSWWQERIFDRCISRVEEGLFVDQKWVDLVPGMFDGVHILTDPGYNVAYWNLHCRELEVSEDITVNGRPLAFFHFSGIDPRQLDVVSRHQNRYQLNDIGDAAELYHRYAALLADAGHDESSRWSYCFGEFDDGTPIPDLARDLFRSLGDGRDRFGNPFAVADGFKDWLNGPFGAAPTRLTRLGHHIWLTQDHLKRAYPDPTGEYMHGLADWIEDYGQAEFKLAEEFLAPMRGAEGRTRGQLTAPMVRRSLRRRLWTFWISDPMLRVKLRVRRILGEERWQRLKRVIKGRTMAPIGVGPEPEIDSIIELPAGVNVIGYLRTESGVGESARRLVRSLQAADVSLSLTDLDLGVASRRSDTSLEGIGDDHDYAVNLMVVNADQVEIIAANLGPERFAGRVNVGFWAWEMERFPDEWLPALSYFDELWTHSRFCVDVFSSVSPVPVQRVPMCVEVPPDLSFDRSEFGLSDDDFLVLTIFDFLSYFERKNPLALIEAFRRGLGDRGNAVLVLKTANTEFAPEQFADLRRHADKINMHMIDETLDREAVWRLMGCCDAYASLHRAEGFGLTLVEAMALGKPVVATAYSGNTDFMNPANSLPVGFRLVPVRQQHGPYRPGWLWAEPEVDHASELLRRLYDDPELGRRIGDRARSDVKQWLSPAAVARVIAERMVSLLRRQPAWASRALARPGDLPR
jgi:glycosyltransferase involved in cell wall biosynthesis